MSNLTGRELVAAIKKGATWGTAVAVGAGDGILLNSDGLSAGHAIESLMDNSLGKGQLDDLDKGKETASGDLQAFGRYQGQELPLSLIFGDPQAKTLVSPYEQEIYLADSVRGLFATYAALVESGVVFEVPSAKFTGMTIAGEFGNPLNFTFNTVGNVLNTTGDGKITNLPANLQAVTMDAEAALNRIIMDQNSSFWINLQSDGALDAADCLGITAFSFAIQRPVDMVFATCAATNGQIEPVENAMPNLTLSINLPDFNDGAGVDARALKDSLRSNVKYKARFMFAKGTDYAFGIYVPSMVVTQHPVSAQNPGRISSQVTFTILKAASAPAGMSDASTYLYTKNLEPNAAF